MNTRTIKYIAVHCSATKPAQDIGVDDIRRWHKAQGWKDVGYHYVIRRDGTLEDGRPESVAGAHVSGFNSNSIGVCLAGGINAQGKAENNFTPEQWDTLKLLLRHLRAKYPAATIQGHRDFPNVKKDCPCFDVKSWVKDNL